MSSIKISVSTEPPKPDGLTGKELVLKVVDPEIARFEEWFSKPETGNSRLTPMERELLRAYLYQKLTGTI
jgi:hypothetical protein